MVSICSVNSTDKLVNRLWAVSAHLLIFMGCSCRSGLIPSVISVIPLTIYDRMISLVNGKTLGHFEAARSVVSRDGMRLQYRK